VVDADEWLKANDPAPKAHTGRPRRRINVEPPLTQEECLRGWALDPRLRRRPGRLSVLEESDADTTTC
jgi:hypothetical protein